MAEALTPEILGGSTDGAPISITGTNTGSANTIHTASATTDVIDEVWLWAYNHSAAAVKLSVEWGSDTTEIVEVSIPAESGLIAIVPGIRLKNSKTVKAFAATTAVVAIIGNVNRYTPS